MLLFLSVKHIGHFGLLKSPTAKLFTARTQSPVETRAISVLSWQLLKVGIGWKTLLETNRSL